jgi:hypothetical protein
MIYLLLVFLVILYGLKDYDTRKRQHELPSCVVPRVKSLSTWRGVWAS